MAKKADEDTLYKVLLAIKQIIAGSRTAERAMNLTLAIIEDWEAAQPK